MTYSEATDYLFNSAPLFQNVGAGAYKEGLANTLALDEHTGHPHRAYKTIHVGGTNGKGSVSHTLASILQHSGLRVGLYTSPHLVDFRERIRVNGRMIPEERVVRFVEEERSFFEPLHPSFFELATALAFKYFEEEQVDVAVIEVGLGGRLDCTNIIHPQLSVITNISFDHTQFLGHTLPEIAREKAGIIKEGVPVVIGEAGDETPTPAHLESKTFENFRKFSKIPDSREEPTVRSVFEEKARDMHAPITFAEEQTPWLAVEPELRGDCQTKNTRTILAATCILRQQGISIPDEAVREGFRTVCETTGLMGRWQKLSDRPTVVCDTGHNVGGWQYLGKQLSRWIDDTRHESKTFENFRELSKTFDSKEKAHTLHMVVGMVNDKDINAVLSLMPREARYYFTQASVKRALPAEDFARQARQHALQGDCYPTVREALQAAKAQAAPEDFVFIGGSTFIVADALRSFFHESKILESSRKFSKVLESSRFTTTATQQPITNN